LLTLPNKLPKYTKDELVRLKSKHVFIMGQQEAVSNNVQKEIEKLLKVKAVRLGGSDHYKTSIEIANNIKYYNDIIIVYGKNYTYGKTYIDSIPVAPIAGAQGTPILYIDYDKGAKEISGFLKNAKVNNIYLLNGGQEIDKQMIALVTKLTKKVPIVIKSRDIFEANLNIIKSLDSSNKFDFKNVLIVGDYSKDNMKSLGNALTGAALASKLNAVVVLIDKKISGQTEQYLKQKLSSDTRYIVLGGDNLVPSSFIKNNN
jgi:cell wall-associated protease